jgi:plasmid maintenance system antidote protein VapI
VNKIEIKRFVRRWQKFRNQRIVKEFRKHNYKQKDAAKALKMSPSNFSSCINGRRYFTEEQVFNLAKFLKLNPIPFIRMPMDF